MANDAACPALNSPIPFSALKAAHCSPRTSSSKRLLADVEHEAREEASQNHPCEIDVAHPGSSYMD